MKILAIRGKNLASLEGEFKIDFTQEPLYSAGIFAITGNTGAGKSTLLDAVCLALFAEIPRLISAQENGVELADSGKNSISQNDVRSILRKGTADGYAEVDFIGQDNKTYRSRWSVRRARNKVENQLQTDTVELTQLPSEERLGGKKTETLKLIKEILGLNFEQFTRSVLLAQNDFTAFLKADKNEKASLLERLTGTDIYSKISIVIYEKWKKANEELLLSQRQLEGIILLNDEEIVEINNKKAEIEKKLKIIDNQSKSIENSLKWHTDLNILTESKDKAASYLSEIEKKSNEVADKQITLQQIDKLQVIKSDFDGQKECLKSIAIQKNQLINIKNKIESTENELKTFEIEEKTTNEKLSDILNEQETARPLLDNAKKFDIQIDSSNIQLISIDKELNSARQKTKEANDNKEANYLKIEKLKLEVEKINNWFNQNEIRKPIAENITEIKLKLNDAGERFSNELKLEKDIKQITSVIEQLKSNIKKHNQELSTKSNLLKENKLQLSDIEIKIKELNPESIIEQKETQQERHIHLSSAKEAWKNLIEDKIKLKNYQHSIEQLKYKQLENNKNLIVLNENANQVSIQLKQTKKLLENSKASVYENIKNIREQLIENQPCPVCGSKEHPYSGETENLQKVFHELEQEVSSCENKYAELQKRIIKKEQEIETDTNSLQILDIEIKNLENEIELNTSKWKSSVLYNEYKEINEDSVIVHFDNELQKVSAMLLRLSKQEKEYYTLSNTLNEKRKELDNAAKEISDIEKLVAESIRKSDVETRSLKAFSEEKNTNQQRFSELINQLNTYFLNNNWLNNWKENHADFLNKAIDFSNQWKSENEQLTEKQQALKTTESLSENLAIQYIEAQKAENIVFQKQQQIQVDKNQLQQNRNQLFEGKAVELVEKNFFERITNIQSKLNIIRKKVNDVKSIYLNLLGNKEGLEKQINSLQEKNEDYSQKLQNFIISYNKKNEDILTNESLSELLSYPPDWINEQRLLIQQVKENLIQSHSTFEERNTQLQKHLSNKTTEESVEELKQQQENNKSVHQTQNELKTELDFKLRQNELNKEKCGNILNEIQTKTVINERWGKLNLLIGSADGKKFRQIAQEYTLDVLLVYANTHLQELAGRYRIERISETLALQVIDQDMGDEIRSVHSLSGGESFLVSLALALGLASLSSNRMNIESLFIDEGFGSLDPETLRIAMDALDQLHTQGRKVGVITHVREMTERIPTQIVVEKTSLGKSRIQIR